MSEPKGDVISDIKAKIQREERLIDGFKHMKNSTTNPQVMDRCISQIRETQQNINYLQATLSKLTLQTAATEAAEEPLYLRLDLVKYECPSLGHRIQYMLQQLEFKLQREKQYREGNEKLSRLYERDGDKRIVTETEGGKLESDLKIQLLSKSLKRYQDMYIDIDDVSRDNKIMTEHEFRRKPLSGTLKMAIQLVRDVDHIASPLFSKKPETAVVVKVDDAQKARTRGSRSGKWTEEFTIDIEKGNEVELSVYDKSSEQNVPVAVTWFLLADLVEELRKKKVSQELGKTGWVSASKIHDSDLSSRGDGSGFNMNAPVAAHAGEPTDPGTDEPVTTSMWIVLEPAGKLLITASFTKSNIVGGNKHVNAMGGLGRHGAIRQKKEEVFEQHGHQFVQKQFYNIMCCALCGDFLRYSGYQCQDCKFLCHKKCYQKVVTKCISKSSIELDPDEAKLNHRIPHRFEPLLNRGTKWCCHCGYILPWGRKNIRKCSECGVMCHALCIQLVPDFCGMSMEMANRILTTIKSTKHTGPKLPQNAIQHHHNDYPDHTKLPTLVTHQKLPPIPVPAHHTKRLPPVFDKDLLPEVLDKEVRSGAESFDRAESHTSSPGAEEDANQSFEEKQESVTPPVQSHISPKRLAPRVPEIFEPVEDRVGRPTVVAPESIPQKPKRKHRRKVGIDDFKMIAVLGKGNFGKVMLAQSKRTAYLCAIKVLKKDVIIETSEIESTKSEKRVFLVANKEQHPFLLNLHCCFQTENRIYYVMEYIAGGDLMYHVQKGKFTPRRAQFYAAEVLLALKYLHENGVIYRDLKLDNIMLTTDGHIKVADYGLCKENMWYGNTTNTFCGTPEFMAPELVTEQPYGRAVDWWTFGVLLYQMILNQSPFKGDDEDEIFNAIVHDEVVYNVNMSRESVLILQALLDKNPQTRLGAGTRDAKEIMEDPYFRNIDFDDIFHRRVPPPFIPELRGGVDFSNFDREFTDETPCLTPVDTTLTSAMQEQFRGFSHISDDMI
ncbi:hypothetical protein BABINDRAFT_162941 [Babjeviella inositovora NRRL Y-12698]|uniref:Protein kinase C-like 1 n=1 Tax=Babjeviella inositovora NRRL Y-12698 TaxID=984486 RepID=A0A1E3QKV7_9ASCO|nr:uncharacterized protein BABINDRAFT_162941 [Babjeviella inositovora NRRL Y-12698]ODQ78290.1 hypothetical protein BABINDRAFT_162941 [Babjeviella inositovora NRRL Y-12698]